MRRALPSNNLALDDLPAIVGTETAWAMAAISADAGRATEAVAIADAGYTVATRCFDAPHMRFNIADAHVSALLLSGRVSEALEVAERVRQQAADLPGAAQSLGAAVAGRAALGAGRLDTACLLLEQAAAALAASGHAIGWGYRYHIPRAIALAMRGCTDEAVATLAALDTLRRPFRSLDYERSVARAWVTASQGAISEAITILLSAAKKASAQRAIRGRSDLPADRHTVRRSHQRTQAARTRSDRRRAACRLCGPLRRRLTRRGCG